MADYYAILGIQPSATSGQIKVAYRRLALKYHPDTNPNDALADKKFIEITLAYKVLSNPEQKRNYDLGLPVDFDLQEQEDLKSTVRRPPPQYYYKYRTEPINYERKHYLYAAVSVAAIIIIAIVFPIYLMLNTSTKYYEQAVSYYFQGRYYSALQSVDLSIKDFSNNNSEACALASVILVHKLHEYDYALSYINKGLSYNPGDSLASELHYMKGICLSKSQMPNEALLEFEQVGAYSHAYDSSLFRAAVMLNYYLDKPDSATILLDRLLTGNKNHYSAKYFKGVIYEQKGNYEEAQKFFTDLIGTPFNQAAAYYQLARTEIKLNQSDSACTHLKIASSYNLTEAIQLKKYYCEKESIFLSPYN